MELPKMSIVLLPVGLYGMCSPCVNCGEPLGEFSDGTESEENFNVKSDD